MREPFNVNNNQSAGNSSRGRGPYEIGGEEVVAVELSTSATEWAQARWEPWWEAWCPRRTGGTRPQPASKNRQEAMKVRLASRCRTCMTSSVEPQKMGTRWWILLGTISRMRWVPVDACNTRSAEVRW